MLGVGVIGSAVKRSGGSSAGASNDNVPSPKRELARPPEWRNQRTGSDPGGGQSG